jgi:hypothetical protein
MTASAHRPFLKFAPEPALDARSRQVLALDVGERSRKSARQLWNQLSAVDLGTRRCALVIFCRLESYEIVRFKISLSPDWIPDQKAMAR